jgi:hypothetical protein
VLLPPPLECQFEFMFNLLHSYPSHTSQPKTTVKESSQENAYMLKLELSVLKNLLACLSFSQNQLQVLHLNRPPCLNCMKIHFSTFSYRYYRCPQPFQYRTLTSLRLTLSLSRQWPTNHFGVYAGFSLKLYSRHFLKNFLERMNETAFASFSKKRTTHPCFLVKKPWLHSTLCDFVGHFRETEWQDGKVYPWHELPRVKASIGDGLRFAGEEEL